MTEDNEIMLAMGEQFDRMFTRLDALVKEQKDKSLWERAAPYIVPLVIGLFTFFIAYQSTVNKVEMLSRDFIKSNKVCAINHTEVRKHIRSDELGDERFTSRFTILEGKVLRLQDRVSKTETKLENHDITGGL